MPAFDMIKANSKIGDSYFFGVKNTNFVVLEKSLTVDSSVTQ